MAEDVGAEEEEELGDNPEEEVEVPEDKAKVTEVVRERDRLIPDTRGPGIPMGLRSNRASSTGFMGSQPFIVWSQARVHGEISSFQGQATNEILASSAREK